MAYTSEIEKLERRNAENPQGRLFAPLADAYRKQGDVERALALLREGLERHPDYIGAQIVLGRCHLDLGQEAEASAAFTRVLDLDGENVIALRALAEIAERGGRQDEAIRHLERLLDIDRGNEEAAAHLERLRSAPVTAAAGTEHAAGEPTADGAPTAEAGAPAEATPPGGIELTNAFGADRMGDEDAGPPALADLEVAEVVVPPDVEAAPIEGLVVPEELEAQAVEGIEVVEPVTAGPDEDEGPGPVAEIEPLGLEGEEIVLEREVDIELAPSEENEFQRQSDAERLAASAAAAEGDAWQDLSAEAAPPVEPVAPVAWDDGGDAPGEAFAALDEATAEAGEEAADEDLAEEGEPDLVVTETMAAVYERQGLHGEALRVYRELSARRPGDERLAAKVAELEAAQEAAAEPPAPEPPAPGPPARRAAEYAAAATGGESLGSFLRGVLAARLSGPGAATAPAPAPAAIEEAGLDAAPTRPAADPVSLSAVFGDDLPPTAPAGSQPASSPGQGFSFDAFFGGGGSQGREGPRPTVAGEDDLEQFHAWLQGLKK